MISLITSSTTDPSLLLWTRRSTDQPYHLTVKVVKTLTQELQVNYVYTVLIIQTYNIYHIFVDGIIVE